VEFKIQNYSITILQYFKQNFLFIEFRHQLKREPKRNLSQLLLLTHWGIASEKLFWKTSFGQFKEDL
jgi:hypothetical protein